MPGATDKGGMKLIDVLGRLLLLALRKTGSAARFCVAAGAVASLAGALLLQWVRPSMGRQPVELLGMRRKLCRLCGCDDNCIPNVCLVCLAPFCDNASPAPSGHSFNGAHVFLSNSALLCAAPAPGAESCLASQTVGSTRHGSSPDVDRVLGVLATELGTLVEGSLRAAQRCAVVETLLYLQAREAGLGSVVGPGCGLDGLPLWLRYSATQL